MAVGGWEVVFEGDAVAANVAAAVLESHDIPVQVFDDTAYGSLIRARLFVPRERVEEARELLEDAPK